MPPLARDVLEVLMVVALGGALWSAAARIRRGQLDVARCPGCGRPVSRTYGRCPRCGGAMNFHAEKIDRAADGGSEEVVAEFHTCPACKYVLERAAV